MSFQDRSPFLFKPPEQQQDQQQQQQQEQEQQQQQPFTSQQQLHFQPQHHRQHSLSHHQQPLESQLGVTGQLNPHLLSHPSFPSSNVPSPLLTPNAYDSIPTSANSLDFIIPSPSSLEQLSAGLMTPSDDQCSPFGSASLGENGLAASAATTANTPTTTSTTPGQIHQSDPAIGFVRPVRSSFSTETDINPKLPSPTYSTDVAATIAAADDDDDGDAAAAAAAAVPWGLHQQPIFSFPLPPPQPSDLPPYYSTAHPLSAPPPPVLSSDSPAPIMTSRPGTAPAASALMLMSRTGDSSQTLAPSRHPGSSPGGPVRFTSTNPGQDDHPGFAVDQASGAGRVGGGDGGNNNSNAGVSQLSLNPNAYRHSLPDLNPASFGFSSVLADGSSPRLLSKSLGYLHDPSGQFFYPPQQQQQQQQPSTAASNIWPGQQQQQSISFNLDPNQGANGSYPSNANTQFPSAYPSQSPTMGSIGSDSGRNLSQAQSTFLQSQQPHLQQQKQPYSQHQFLYQSQPQYQHQHQQGIRYNPYGGARPKSKDSIGPFDKHSAEGEHAGNRGSFVGHPGAGTSRPQTSDGISENYHFGHQVHNVGSIDHSANGFAPINNRPSTTHSSSVVPFDDKNNHASSSSSSSSSLSYYPHNNPTGFHPEGTFAFRPTFPSSNGSGPFGYRPDTIPLSVLDGHRRPMTSPSVSSNGLPPKTTLGLGRRGRSQSNAQPGTAAAAAVAAAASGGLKKTKHKTMNTTVKPFEPLPLELRPISLVTGKPKRPRRKHDQVERLYACEFKDCGRSYGTLNHLNTHIISQNHGEKRTPAEFRELRRIWRRKRKEEASKNASLEKEPAVGVQKKRKSSGNNSTLSGMGFNGEGRPNAAIQLRKDSIVSGSSYGKESDDHSSAEEEGYDDDDDDDRPETSNGDSLDDIGAQPSNYLSHHRFSLPGTFQSKATIQRLSEDTRSVDPYTASAATSFDPSYGNSHLGAGGESGMPVGMSMSMSTTAEPSPFSWSVPDPFTPPTLMGFQPFGGAQTAQGGQLINQASHVFGIF